jgi:hypothetical protein
MENINHIQDVLIQMHSGQWFGWSDPSNRVYENLVINGDYEKPTQEFLESELARLQAEYDSQAYARNRQAEYPPIGDQLDALFHAGVFPADMAAKLQAVKDTYPND